MIKKICVQRCEDEAVNGSLDLSQSIYTLEEVVLRVRPVSLPGLPLATSHLGESVRRISEPGESKFARRLADHNIRRTAINGLAVSVCCCDRYSDRCRDQYSYCVVTSQQQRDYSGLRARIRNRSVFLSRDSSRICNV